MKFSLIITLLFCFSSIYGQQKYESSFSKRYDKKAKYELKDLSGNTVMTFIRDHKDRQISAGVNSYFLLNRSLLKDSVGNEIATFKKHAIILTEDHIIIEEQSDGSGWTYFQDGKQLVKINYDFFEATHSYSFVVEADLRSELHQYITMISLGKAEKFMVMEYKPKWVGMLVAGILGGATGYLVGSSIN